MAVWAAQRLSMVRGFARYLQTVDPAPQVPPADLLSARTRRVGHRHRDTNAAERALCRPVVTRYAYGSRNEDAARLAARVWIVTATAEIAGLNVLTYLSAYLDACGHNGDLIMVGDRGMITSARIRALKETGGPGWITCLRAPAIRKLAAEGPLQVSLFDQQDLAEITSPDSPASG